MPMAKLVRVPGRLGRDGKLRFIRRLPSHPPHRPAYYNSPQWGDSAFNIALEPVAAEGGAWRSAA